VINFKKGDVEAAGSKTRGARKIGSREAIEEKEVDSE